MSLETAFFRSPEATGAPRGAGARPSAGPDAVAPPL